MKKAPDARRALLPLALLLLLGAVWGVSTTVTRIAMTGGVPPLAFGFWQCLIASAILLAIGLKRGGMPPLDRAHLRYYAFTGAVGLALPAIVMYLALGRIAAGLMSTIVSLAPLMTYLVALAVATERFDRLRGAGILLGLGGALVLLLPERSLPTPEIALWAALALLTPTLYAVNAVFAGRFMPPSDALTLAAGMVVAATLGFGAGLLLTGQLYLPWPPTELPVAAVWWHGISSALAYGLYFRIIRLAGPVYMSQVGYLVVVIGVATGMLALGERHSPWAWGAIALMVGGVALVNLGQIRRMRQSGRRATTP